MKQLPISLEFFPPKTSEGVEKLAAVRQTLYALKPEFCSVTYGAGGSTQQGTFDTVKAIHAEGMTAAASQQKPEPEKAPRISGTSENAATSP